VNFANFMRFLAPPAAAPSITQWCKGPTKSSTWDAHGVTLRRYRRDRVHSHLSPIKPFTPIPTLRSTPWGQDWPTRSARDWRPETNSGPHRFGGGPAVVLPA
jgi:hypothetical protein